MADYKKLKDTYGFGKRVLAKIKKDPEFLDKVRAARGSTGDYHYRANLSSWPCIGPCLDDAGNPKWITSTKSYLDEADLAKSLPNGITFDDIRMDPVTYSDDENPIVREFARSIANGSENPAEDLSKTHNLTKSQVLNNDGSISRVAYRPAVVNKDGSHNVIESRRIKPFVSKSSYKGYDGWRTEMMDEGERYSGSFNRARKGSAPMLRIRGGWKDTKTGKYLVDNFVNPEKVQGRLIKEGDVHLQGDWKKNRIKNNDIYDITKNQDGSPLTSKDMRNLYSHTREIARDISDDPYRPLSEISGDDTQFMKKSKIKADNIRAENIDAKWDKIAEERKKVYADKKLELELLQKQLKELQAATDEAEASYKAAKPKSYKEGADREADRAQVYKYPELH